MRKLVLSILVMCVACVFAQVTPSPNPIPVGYTGEVTITYDATKGNGALASATAVYANTSLITAESSNTSN